jgi:hypothetical protein
MPDVPIGETTEGYVLRIRQGGVTKREVTLTSSTWIYSAAHMAADLSAGTYQVAVAQVSDRYGSGPEMTLTLEA